MLLGRRRLRVIAGTRWLRRSDTLGHALASVWWYLLGSKSAWWLQHLVWWRVHSVLAGAAPVLIAAHASLGAWHVVRSSTSLGERISPQARQRVDVADAACYSTTALLMMPRALAGALLYVPLRALDATY